MGKHKFWRMPVRLRQAIAKALVFSILLFPISPRNAAAIDQILGPLMSGLGYGLTAAQSAAAGASSIANGNSNVSQGESTMNQAQMMMGMMQIAMGLLGMLAAAAAAAKQKKSNDNANKMAGTTDYPNSYQSTIQPHGGPNSGSNTSGSSNLDSGSSDLGVTPDDLRKGDLGKSMAILEKNFGISRDEFLNGLKNGASPKELLAKAPKNTPSLDTLNRIEAGLAANAASPEDAARALASLGSGGGSLVNPGGGVAQGALAESKETAEDLAKAAAARIKIPNTSPEEDEDAIDKMSVSPEIKAALLAKAAKLKAERDMRDSSTWSIFQLVHSRYRKLETMLYGRVERTNIPSPSDATKGF